MILIVLLSGGDYHDGMPGCGLAVAHALARCGFGDRLLNAFNNMARDIFFGYFHHAWVDELCTELRMNSQGFLHARKPQLATQLPAFLSTLDREDVEKYISPLTCWSGLGMVDTSGWVWHPPDVTIIAEFCFAHLGWTDITDLICMLRNNLWGGVIHCVLFSVSYPTFFVHWHDNLKTVTNSN